MKPEKQRRLLLVEDEFLIAMAETRDLESRGYSVRRAQDGEEALRAALDPADPVDLVLMDIDLGAGPSGPETAAAILRRKDLPVVFLSSHTEPEVVEQTESVGSYGYVVKNSGITVLDASIKMAFRLFETQARLRSSHSEIEALNEEMQVTFEELSTSNESLVESERLLAASEAATKEKLRVILDPDEDLSGLKLADIIDARALEGMMRDFYEITGFLTAVLELDGTILVAVGWQDICTKFHRVNSESCRHCLESDTELTRGVPFGSFRAYRCKNNMWDMVTPIVVGGRHLGNLFIGQFLYDDEEIDVEAFRAQARRYGFDEPAYLAALGRVPRFSRKMVERALSFYSRLAEMISSLSFASIKLARAVAEKERVAENLRRDIAEREVAEARLRESEERFRSVFERHSAVKLLIDPRSGAILDANFAAADFYQRSREELRALKVQDLNVMPPEEVRKALDETVHDRRHYFELRHRLADGRIRDVAVFSSNIGEDERGPLHSIIIDITERKLAEERARVLSREKELIYREGHHRIKNNMSSMAALLELQARSAGEEAAKPLLEAAGRLQSMMVLYDKLYRSERLGSLSLRKYLPDLVDEVLRLYPLGAELRVETEVADLVLDAKLLSTLGIIVNELVTNSLKYAFRGRSDGRLSLRAAREDGSLILQFEDDGPGLPAGAPRGAESGYGMRLIEGLAEQLGARAVFEAGAGAKFRLLVPLGGEEATFASHSTSRDKIG